MKTRGTLIGAAALVGWVSMPAVAFEAPKTVQTQVADMAVSLKSAPSPAASTGCEHGADEKHPASCACARCAAPAASE